MSPLAKCWGSPLIFVGILVMAFVSSSDSRTGSSTERRSLQVECSGTRREAQGSKALGHFSHFSRIMSYHSFPLRNPVLKFDFAKPADLALPISGQCMIEYLGSTNVQLPNGVSSSRQAHDFQVLHHRLQEFGVLIVETWGCQTTRVLWTLSSWLLWQPLSSQCSCDWIGSWIRTKHVLRFDVRSMLLTLQLSEGCAPKP